VVDHNAMASHSPLSADIILKNEITVGAVSANKTIVFEGEHWSFDTLNSSDRSSV